MNENSAFCRLPYGYKNGRLTEDTVQETMAERILSSEK